MKLYDLYFQCNSHICSHTYYLDFYSKRVVKTKKSIPKLVKTKFENDGFEVVLIEDAHKNRNSPFYQKRFAFNPSTGYGSIDLFSHRIYKVTLLSDKEQSLTKWVDCLYFLKYELWFVVEDQKEL